MRTVDAGLFGLHQMWSFSRSPALKSGLSRDRASLFLGDGGGSGFAALGLLGGRGIEMPPTVWTGYVCHASLLSASTTK